MVHVCKVHVNKFHTRTACHTCIICNYRIKHSNKYPISLVFNCYYNIKVITKMSYLSHACHAFLYTNVTQFS